MNTTKTYYYSDFLKDNANLSLKNHDEVCEVAYSFRKNNSIFGMVFLNALLSLLTLVLLYLLMRCKEMRRVWSLIDLDLKVIFLLLKDFLFKTLYY